MIRADDIVTPAVVRLAGVTRSPILSVGGGNLASLFDGESGIDLDVVDDDVICITRRSRANVYPYLETNWPHVAATCLLYQLADMIAPRDYDYSGIHGARIEPDSRGDAVARWSGGRWLRTQGSNFYTGLVVGELARHKNDALAEDILRPDDERKLVRRIGDDAPPKPPTHSYRAWLEWLESHKRGGR